ITYDTGSKIMDAKDRSKRQQTKSMERLLHFPKQQCMVYGAYIFRRSGSTFCVDQLHCPINE
ncbi:hypothetical protein NY599_26560, partial [Enterobacter hormaechei]|nr:hypothetical protein [Enterobacter hormaechei]